MRLVSALQNLCHAGSLLFHLLGKENIVKDNYTLAKKGPDCPENIGAPLLQILKNNSTLRKSISFLYFYDNGNEKVSIQVISTSHWKMNGC